MSGRAGSPRPTTAMPLGCSDPSQLDVSEQQKVMAVVGLSELDLPEIMIHDFRKNGYVPEVLLNFLALQGWSAGGDLEHMTRSEERRVGKECRSRWSP